MAVKGKARWRFPVWKRIVAGVAVARHNSAARRCYAGWTMSDWLSLPKDRKPPRPGRLVVVLAAMVLLALFGFSGDGAGLRH